MARRKRRPISHRDFVRDLGRGAVGEDIACSFFLKEFGIISKNVSERNPDFDIILYDLDEELLNKPKVVPKKLLKKVFKDFGFHNKEELTVEVKFDEAAARYKNFFIEVFFNVEDGSPGSLLKCKSDLIVWVVPNGKKHKIYMFNRAGFLAWFFEYIFENRKSLKLKTPGISPMARGIAVPIELAKESFSCLGVFDFRL